MFTDIYQHELNTAKMTKDIMIWTYKKNRSIIVAKYCHKNVISGQTSADLAKFLMLFILSSRFL